MAKYAVGDKVKLTSLYRGVECIITEVHEDRPKYQYIAQKENGRGGRYKLSDAQIETKVGGVDVSTLPQKGLSRTDEALGQQYAMNQAQALDGTPAGDRWLLLATTKVGDPIKLHSRGKIITATLVEVKPRGLKYVFTAQKATGGTYKFPLSVIHIEGEITASAHTGPVFVLPNTSLTHGTLGDLMEQGRRLLSSGVPADTKVFVSSDAEGNSYNTAHSFNIQQGKDGKIITLDVNHDNLMDEEVFA